MSRSIFYIDDDFVLSSEHMTDEVLVVHCDVYNWNHRVLKRMYVEWGKMIVDSGEEGYKYLDSFSPNPKFCEFAAFKHMGLDFDLDGIMHSHYRFTIGE